MFKPIDFKDVIARCCGIWVDIIGEIWNHRNMMVFKNEYVDLIEVFTAVKRKIWSWITVKERLTDFSYSD